MALKCLSSVVLGDVIKLGGVNYKVSSTKPFGIMIRKAINTPSMFGSTQLFENAQVSIMSLISDYRGPEHHFVVVLEDTESAPKSDLSSELRKQLAQSSLTESLREQVSVDSEDEDDDDCDEYCSCDDCDDEDEEDSYPDSYPTSFSPGHVAAYAAPVYGYGPSGVSAVSEEAKKAALSANLRAQASDQKATQAQLSASLAQKVTSEVKRSIQYAVDELSGLGEEVSSISQNVQSLDEDLVNNWDYSHAVSDVAHGVLDRVVKIENKLQEEENKMTMQNELNRKLALQKDFSNSLNKKTTGGNGMTNLLAGFKNQFGKVEGKFAFSAVTQGLAIRKGISNEFVAFNAESGEITDVTGLTLDFKVPAFKLPTAASEVKKGDIVLNNVDFGYVTRVHDGFVEVIIPEKNANGSVRPTKNALMGTSFYTVVKTLDAAGQGGFNPMMLLAMGDGEIDATTLMMMSGGFGGAQAGQANGMQSMLPFLLMGDKDKGGKGSKDLLPLMMMSGGLNGGTQQAGGINPMMLMALGGDGDIDPMTLMMMSGGFGGQGGGLFGQAPATQAPAKAPDSTDGE